MAKATEWDLTVQPEFTSSNSSKLEDYFRAKGATEEY